MSADQQPCPDCGGAGGAVETEQTDGIFRQTWHPCTTCTGQ